MTDIFKNLAALLSIVLLSQNTYAQKVKTTVKQKIYKESASMPAQLKELGVGDKLPDIQLHLLDGDMELKINTSKFGDRLMILDFWDTYCTSCIEAMPKVQDLQKTFGNKIAVLPVTYQDAALIKNFFNTNRFLKSKNVKLPSVVNDKLLRKYFKHQGVPHVVWIYKGIVKAITTSEYVNTKNIQVILDGNDVNWPVKNDFLVYNYNDSPLVNIDTKRLAGASPFKKYAAVTSYMKDIPRKFGSVSDNLNKTIRDYNFNSSIIQTYYYAMSMIKPSPFSPAPNRIILEVNDRNKYLYDPSLGFSQDWEMKNSICFESVVADSTSEAVRGKMIVEQLNRLLNLNGRLEKRKVKCLIISKTDQQAVKHSDTVAFFNNRPVKELIKWLDASNMIKNQYPPIIDETSYSGTLSLNKWKDVPSLKSELQKQGFDINEGERMVGTFILTEMN